MNEAMHERLSALSDGELQGDEVRFLLRGLAGVPGPQASWARYQLVRTCLRRGDFVVARVGFADGVLAQIAGDASQQRGRTWLKTAAGGLIAASVAVIALLAIAPANVETPVQAVASTPALTGNTGLRTEDLRPQIPARVVSAGDMPGPMLSPVAPLAGEDEIEAYLIGQSNASYGAGRYAIAPYVYVIGPVPAQTDQGVAGVDAEHPAPQQ